MAVDMGSAVAYLKLDTRDFDLSLDTSLSKLRGVGDKVVGIGRNLGAGIALVSAATVAGLATIGKTSVETGMQFDSSMSQVAATMGKTVDEIQELSDFAMEMGETTVFSASQAADALNFMALAGYDANTSMQMLPNVLNLAAAGGIELARASDMVTDAQSALGLSLDDTTKLVDQMAKTASSSNTSVAQLGEAILTIGASARDIKGGTVELNTLLGSLADNGIKGAEGGTHLRNMIISLKNPTKEGYEALEKLGISVYDSSGEMRSMIDIISDLRVGMKDMDGASRDAILNGLFNKTDLAAVNALLNTNEDRWKELSVAIEESAGAAEKMANTQLDNLSGDITLLKSALEGAEITISRSLTPTIRRFVQFGTREIGKFNRAFQEGGFKGLAKQVGESLADTIKIVYAYIPDIIDTGYEFASSFIDSVADNLPGLASRLSKAIPRFFSKVGKFFEKELPNVVSNIGVAIGELFANSGKIIASGAKLVGSIITGTLASIPELVKGIVSGVEQGLSESEYNLTAYTESIKDKIDSITTGMDSLDDSLAAINGKQLEAEHWIEIFSQLSGKTSLSKQETELLNTAVEKLNGLFPDLDLHIDENTGQWSQNADEVERSVKAIQERAKAEAYLNMASKLYEEIAALDLERKKVKESADAVRGRKEALETTVNSTQSLIDTIDELYGSFNLGEISADDLMAALEKLVPDRTIRDVSDTSNLLATLRTELKHSQEELDGTTAEYEEASDAVALYDDAIDELTDNISWLYEQGSQQVTDATGKMTEGFDKASESAKNSGSAAGKSFVDSTVNAINSGAGRIRGAAQNALAVDSTISIGGRGKASYATGLDYVPRTMDVTVHRGERILTAEENEEYNKGGSIEVVSYQNDEAINTLNSTMTDVLDAIKDLRNMQISLDGKRLVGGIVSEMDRQLGVRAQRAGV